MPEKILLVDDERTFLETLEYNLRRQGYEIISSDNGNDALVKARTEKPDLIVLDIMLPGMDGFEVCRILRQEMHTPILMLTARDDEIDRVVGLEVGADDYLTKPFSMRELMARIKALFRRVRLIREEMAQPTADQSVTRVLKYDELVIDTNRREVKLKNRVISMKPREYELLVFLAHHHSQVVTREYILEKVWGWDFFGDSRTVDVHVRWLREKIEQDPQHPSRIVTVRGAGYRFEG